VCYVWNSADHILPPEVPLEIPPPFIVRVLLIYGRSYCEPTFNITKVQYNDFHTNCLGWRLLSTQGTLYWVEVLIPLRRGEGSEGMLPVISYINTSHSANQLGIIPIVTQAALSPHIIHPWSPFSIPVCMHAGPSALMSTSIASAHYPPAPLCATVACPVPNLPAVAHGCPVMLRNEKCQFYGPDPWTPPKFFVPKTIPGNPGVSLKIWRHIAPPVFEL